MRRLLLTLTALTLSFQAFSQSVTLSSLLREMVDRQAVTRFPDYRAHQASSYNRTSVSPDAPGWFADSDGVWCIREETNAQGETEWVLMEDNGPGAITKIWAVCFYYGLADTTGANVRIYIDGSPTPVIDENFFALVKGQSFVAPPLAAETRRAGNLYLPIPYAKSCKVTMDKKVFYNIISYRRYPAGTPVESFNMTVFEQNKPLVDSVNRVLAQGIDTPSAGREKSTRLTLAPGEKSSVRLPKGTRALSDMTFNVGDGNQLRQTILSLTFDGRQTVWSPIGDFFSVGVGIRPYSTWERSAAEDGTLRCRWMMPYRESASATFENLSDTTVQIEFAYKTVPYDWTSESMYFHSRWKSGEPTPGFPLFDYNMVEVQGRGVYVGDQFTVLNPAEGWWGEGDEKVWVDNESFPSLFGTGTEDYYGWAGGVVPTSADQFSVPFLANVRVADPNSKGYNTCTRTRSLDAIPFAEHLRFDIESSGSMRYNWFHMLYAVNAFWYADGDATDNAEELRQYASQPPMTLSALEQLNATAKEQGYSVDGAIEAENLSTYTLADGAVETDAIDVWGDRSGGRLKGFNLPAGGSVTVRLTELFAETPLKMCVVTNSSSSEVEIRVNGELVRTLNLNSEHAAMPVIDLGSFEPKENALEIRFTALRNTQLGLDYFLTK